MAELLPLINIGDVHFDEVETGPGNGISQRNTGVGECAGIKDYATNFFIAQLLYTVDEFAFVIALKKDQLHAKTGSDCFQVSLQIFQRGTTINVSLTLAEASQVRSI